MDGIWKLYNLNSQLLFSIQYDIAKVDLYDYRKQIGFVPQDCMLFQGSIFSNIAVGDSKVESEKVIQVAKLACGHDFIMKLPNAYGTPIGEKG